MKGFVKKATAAGLSALLLASQAGGIFVQAADAAPENGWYHLGTKSYWYENGVRQGYDPSDASYRGKEIYDPASDAWYWLMWNRVQRQ